MSVAVANAAPVPDDERIAVDVRRTTLIVRNVDRSLAFDRDALGLQVVCDQTITRTRTTTSSS